MGAIREQKRAQIMQRELKPDCMPSTSIGGATGQQPTSISDVCYSLENAKVDVQEYFNLGSIHRALASIDAETQKINQQTPSSPLFTSPNSTTFTVSTPGTFTVTATGTPTPTLSESGPLPNGVQFNSATGVLSGTAGAYQISFTASNSGGGDATQSFKLTVNPASPTITSANTTTFTVGTQGTFTATATGTPTPTLTESGPLPAGVQFSTTGVLSGTPAAGTTGSYPIRITASNGQGLDATQNFTLRVN
jgi:hypothetical protein